MNKEAEIQIKFAKIEIDQNCLLAYGANCKLNHTNEFRVNQSATRHFILYPLRPNPFVSTSEPHIEGQKLGASPASRGRLVG